MVRVVTAGETVLAGDCWGCSMDDRFLTSSYRTEDLYTVCYTSITKNKDGCPIKQDTYGQDCYAQNRPKRIRVDQEDQKEFSAVIQSKGNFGLAQDSGHTRG